MHSSYEAISLPQEDEWQTTDQNHEQPVHPNSPVQVRRRRRHGHDLVEN